MAGFDQDISLVALARFASSKIRTLKSSDDYRKWIQERRQTRGTEGLPTNKLHPSTSGPQLLFTWERLPSGSHEKRASYRPGYKWAVHGVLNPRYGTPLPKTPAAKPDASNGPDDLQAGAGGQSTSAGAPQARPRSGSADDLPDRSIPPRPPNPNVSAENLQPSPSPNSSYPLTRDVRRTHARGSGGRASALVSDESERPNEDSSPAENLTTPRNASTFVASSSHCDQGVSHRNTVDQTGTREPRELRRSQAADSLRTSAPSETQDRSDTSTNAGTGARRSLEQQSTQATDGPRTSTFAESQVRSGISTCAKSSAKGDVMTSLNRKIDRTLKETRRRTLQRVQDGALDDIVNGPTREAAQEVFN